MFKLLLILLCGNSFAQVNVILTNSPGGGAEITCRQMEKYLLQEKDIKLVILYKPGANGLIGLQELSKAPKDGTTIAYVTIGQLLEIQKTTDLQVDYVTAINKLPMVLVTNNKTNITNYNEFVKQSKTVKPYSFGSTGPAQSFAIKQIIDTVKPKTEMVVAPYKAGTNVISDLIGGQIDFAYLTYPSVKEFVESKKLVILASSVPIKDYPNLYRFDKSYKNWVDIAGYAIVLPKDTPEIYKKNWQKLVYDYVNDPVVKNQLAEEYSVPYPLGEDFLKKMITKIK